MKCELRPMAAASLAGTIQLVLGAHAPSRVPTGAPAGRLACQRFTKWFASFIAASCSAKARNTARVARALPIQLHRSGLATSDGGMNLVSCGMVVISSGSGIIPKSPRRAMG